jgi:hypothetical protein
MLVYMKYGVYSEQERKKALRTESQSVCEDR